MVMNNNSKHWTCKCDISFMNAKQWTYKNNYSLKTLLT